MIKYRLSDYHTTANNKMKRAISVNIVKNLRLQINSSHCTFFQIGLRINLTHFILSFIHTMLATFDSLDNNSAIMFV